jgi:TatD DNase family protein
LPTLPDCHAHLDRFDERVAELVAEAENEGVSPIVSVGMDVASSQAAVQLAREHANVLAAVGLHPWYVTEQYDGPESLEPYREVASDPAVAAISEVGFDSTIELPLPAQHELVNWFVELAQERALPMILHHRADASELVVLWHELEGAPPRVAIHGFEGDSDTARAFLGEGFQLSIGPSSLGMVGDWCIEDETLRIIPEDRLLVDSDAFVAAMGWPETHPAIVNDVVERIAKVRGDEAAALRAAIASNFERLLGGDRQAAVGG